jgi:hypothetical protein
VSSVIDDYVLPVICPKCAAHIQKPITWFRENHEVTCPCGITIYLATDELLTIIAISSKAQLGASYGPLPKDRGLSRMEAPPVERRPVAILAADVEGYSRLMHGDEEATMATSSATASMSLLGSRD